MSQLTARIFNSIDSITENDWVLLNCSSNIYFNPDFLKAFEASNPNISFKYIIIYDGKKAIGLANIQIISLGVDVILKNIKISNFAKKTLHFLLFPIKIKSSKTITGRFKKV
jgi:hypothetical protein